MASVPCVPAEAGRSTDSTAVRPAGTPKPPKRFKRVYIEISNVCNLHCTFCPDVSRPKSFMDPVLFNGVAKAVAPLTEEVAFHLLGEPLLHPALESLVDICRALDLPIHLTTNGLRLTPARAKTLLNPIFRQINFSLQSFDDNFPGHDNTDYLRAIFEFTATALRRRPDLYVNYRLWNDGAPGFGAANDRWIAEIKKNLGVDVVPARDLRWRKSVPLKGRVSLHFDSRFEWPRPDRPARSDRGFCHGLSTHFGVLTDGTVVPCCLDKDGVIDLGNLRTQNLHEVLQSARAEALRDGFQKAVLVEDLCRKCPFIARFDAKARRIIAGQRSTPARPRP